MIVRVISAIIMAAAVIAVIWLLPLWWLQLFILIAAAIGLIEYCRMFFEDRWERWAAFAAGTASAFFVIFEPVGVEGVVLLLPALLFALSMLFMWRARELPGVAQRLALAVMGVIYLGVSFPLWGWIASEPHGRSYLMLALAPACLCDTFALASGKAFGNRKFAPLVSPKKTVEGFVGALFGSLVGTFFIRYLLLPEISFLNAVLLALIIWIASPLGDLVESMLKRSCGVKDSGTIIPGHGGVLDRLDALIFTGPAAYAFFKYILNL